jgi:hypothetical protein
MDRSREWGHYRAQLRGGVLGLAISGTDAAETTAQFIRQQQRRGAPSRRSSICDRNERR